MSPEILKRVADAQKIAEAAALAWLTQHEQNIESVIHRMLDRRLEEIVAKLMGFSISREQWELDHCNGRAGESAAGDWLRNKAGAAVKDWLDAQAGNLPKLPKRAITSLHNEYINNLSDELSKQLEKRAVEDARQMLLNTALFQSGRQP